MALRIAWKYRMVQVLISFAKRVILRDCRYSVADRFQCSGIPSTSRHPRAGFTLTELMIAMGIGFGVIAATFSAYLFITRNGKSLESQIEFSDMYRGLYAKYTEIIEESRNVAADDDYRGVTISYLEGDGDPIWLGYIEGADVASSKLVVRPEGRSSAAGEVVLCNYISPIYDENGDAAPMFTIYGHSVVLNAHIGDSTRAGDPDTTGPGCQGLVVSIAASSRNLKRKL